MEYTSEQRAAFKDAYTKRFRKKLMMIALVVVALAALAINERETSAIFGVTASVVIFGGWWVFESRNWRCPACNEYLGKPLNPKQCRRCGVELRGSRNAVR